MRGTIVIRDLHAADIELAEAIRERGYVKTSLPQSLVYEPVAGGDEEWLEQLSVKARVHQRKSVLPFDDAYSVECLARRTRSERCRARPPVRALSGRAGART